MKRRPRIFSVKIALACGGFALLASIGGAGALALFGDRIGPGPNHVGLTLYRYDAGEPGGFIMGRFAWIGYERWTTMPEQSMPASVPEPAWADADPRPRWARHREPAWPTDHHAAAAGWPFKGVAGWHPSPAPVRRLGGGVYLAERPSRMLFIKLPRTTYTIPFVPIWPGMLANTLLFFLIPFVPWTLLRWRRLTRIERLGLCYKCRYEFPRELGICPECGTSRPPARGRAR